MNNFKSFTNFNNILIALFTILFCYILFYGIYKSCFCSKIIEGIDGEDNKTTSSKSSDTKSDTKTDPKVVTKESVKKEDEKKKKGPSSKDAEKQANAANQKLITDSKDRKDAKQPPPPANKLLQARFN